MSVQHKEDSIRNLRLVRLGITPPEDWTDVAQVRATKKEEMGLACSAAIYAGIDVAGKHYSLTEHDQTEILTQYTFVKEGAEAVPYTRTGNFAGCSRRRNSPRFRKRQRPISSTTGPIATT